jgi:hypothetical protein
MNHFLIFLTVLILLANLLIGIWRFWIKRARDSADALAFSVMTVAGIVAFCIVSYAIWMATA